MESFIVRSIGRVDVVSVSAFFFRYHLPKLTRPPSPGPTDKSNYLCLVLISVHLRYFPKLSHRVWATTFDIQVDFLTTGQNFWPTLPLAASASVRGTRTNLAIPPEWFVEILAVRSGTLGKEADKSFGLTTHLAGSYQITSDSPPCIRRNYASRCTV